MPIKHGHLRSKYQIFYGLCKICDHCFFSSHFSRLVLFFKEMQFMTSQRNELYGQTEFFANCGGLLGLCLGFSVISAFEIFYYLTLRIVCNLKKYGRHYWSGSEELLESKEKSSNKIDKTWFCYFIIVCSLLKTMTFSIIIGPYQGKCIIFSYSL